MYKNNLYSQNINRKKVKFNEDIKKWNCIIYCPEPDIPFGFNILSFLDLSIPTIPIENVFVSSGLKLPF